MSIILEFSIFPIGKGDSVSSEVTKAVSIIKDSDLEYLIGPMGTCIEGELEEVFDVIKKCIKEIIKENTRVYWTIKGDYRAGTQNRLQKKVDSVIQRLSSKDY